MKTVFIYGEKEKMKNYDEAISFSGARALFSYDPECSKNCDALLLPGGGDLDPRLYGEENTASFGIDNDRSEASFKLIHDFIAAKKPILGICQGLQMVNVALGGSLIQDVENNDIHRWSEETGDRVHRITVTEKSFLLPLYGKSFMVNSAHHQAALRLGEGLEATAFSDDNIVEALQNCEKGIYCVQFHPERMAYNKHREDTVDGAKIFEFFLGLLG